MVISFSKYTAFQQLREHGFVVSFRTEERSRTPRDDVQHTWCNRGRGEEKEFDVNVRHLAEMSPEEHLFAEFWPMSGYESPEEWKKVVLDMHGEVPPTGHFYLVTRGWH